MKRLTWIIFIIVLIIFAYETFRPQAKFPPAAQVSGSRAVAVGQTASSIIA